jgi:4-hydroxy-3-methylbut-2-enyl diphosphate reductase
MKNKITIHLASPRGFCAGVDRAIEIVKKSLEKFGAPIYVRHEIVHNKHVVESLRKKGAIFIEELSEIEDNNRPVVFSAHGIPKSVLEDANFKQIEYIDATCPLVSKVHKEAEQLYKYNYHILLIGHKNHPEVIGTMGQLSNGAIDLIETREDAKNYINNKMKKLSYITQTTLSVNDANEVIQILKNKFPDIKEPKKDDICYATTNRQLAVKEIANKCEMFFVIGSRNSSNSKRLVEAAKKSGCSKSQLFYSTNAVPIEEIIKCKNIGVSSGASAPEVLVDEFIDKIKERVNVEINEIEVAKENIVFKIPNKLT